MKLISVAEAKRRRMELEKAKETKKISNKI